VQHRLLRCYLDAGDGLRARQLLDTMSTGAASQAASVKAALSSSSKNSKQKKQENGKAAAPTATIAVETELADKRSCCCYNRAFIEHISIMLEEPDASPELRDQRLEEGTEMDDLHAVGPPYSALTWLVIPVNCSLRAEPLHAVGDRAPRGVQGRAEPHLPAVRQGGAALRAGGYPGGRSGLLRR
jgi:hypothetical protein